MKKLILGRHGQSMGNCYEPSYYNDLTNTLTLKGIEQAISAGKLLVQKGLHFDHVISSCLTRSVKTASIMIQVMGDEHWMQPERIKTFKDLNERAYFQKFYYDDNKDFVPYKHWTEVETRENHHNRVEYFTKTKLNPLLGKSNILLISHGITMTALLNILAKECIPDVYPLDIKNTEMFELTYNTDGKLVSFIPYNNINDNSHFIGL